MSLADDLAAAVIEQPARVRSAHPKGWEPGIKFDPTTQVPTELTTPAIPKIASGDFSTVLASLDFELPAGYELRLTNASYDPFAWTRDTTDQNKATTKPAWRYKFAVVAIAATVVDRFDDVGLLNRLKRTPKAKVKFTGESAFVTPLHDWQVGKVANGKGTDDLIERLDGYFDMVIERAKDLGKRSLGEIIVPIVGDIVEGCFIYANQSHQVDRNRRQQTNTGTDLIVDYLDRVTSLFDRVRVVAVPGNHGEHRANGKRIDRHDNDDVKVVEDAARTLSRDPKMQHVSFMIAQEEPALTIDILGHIQAFTHGHVYGKATGATPDQKAYNWYRNMAAGHQPVGDATLLYGAHFHHDIVKNYGSLLFVQGPAADNGSPEFADYSGTDCPAGQATYVVTRESRFRDYEVLR